MKIIKKWLSKKLDKILENIVQNEQYFSFRGNSKLIIMGLLNYEDITPYQKEMIDKIFKKWEEDNANNN